MQPTFSNASQVGADPAVGSAGRASLVWLYAIWGVLTAGLLVYSQTLAFTADEGFHMLAAQLIKAGMRPYLDFCFPQTPLNAYWNAFWMRVFGESWRTAHALASLETSAATVLAAQFVLARLPERAWRVAGAIAAAIMIGCSANVVDFGPLGQAYGMCLFTTVVRVSADGGGSGPAERVAGCRRRRIRGGRRSIFHAFSRAWRLCF